MEALWKAGLGMVVTIEGLPVAGMGRCSRCCADKRRRVEIAPDPDAIPRSYTSIVDLPTLSPNNLSGHWTSSNRCVRRLHESKPIRQREGGIKVRRDHRGSAHNGIANSGHVGPMMHS
jgi:hypothetical protein